MREDDEWEEGHVPGSLHVPYYDLKDSVPDDIRAADGERLAVTCSAGIRSSVAASLLRHHGMRSVDHVVDGGIEALKDHGIELEGRPAFV